MRVWVDIENAPQAWFFRPILPALRARGAEVAVTVRDYGEAVALLAAAGESFMIVRAAAGSHRVARVAAVLRRTLALARFAAGRRFDVAISHGVRPHLAAAALLRIPCLTGYDYEHASKLLVHQLACEVLVPRVLFERHLRPAGLHGAKVVAYDGFKEELYLSCFSPDAAIYGALGLEAARPVVTLRPPSFHAHYASTEGNTLFFDVVRHLLAQRALQLVIPVRDDAQRSAVHTAFGDEPRLIMPARPIDGLNLIWHSDLVISGGGTMAREAALLGVPAVSIFRGTPGVLDASLEEAGRLRRIRTAAELDGPVVPTRAPRALPPARTDLVDFLADRIVSHG